MNKSTGPAGAGSGAYAANNLGQSKSGQARRMTLDPDKSYKTMMRRTADTPIESIKAAPGTRPTGEFDPHLADKIAAIEAAEKKTKLICPACGAVSTDLRLSCENCGKYFDNSDAAQGLLNVKMAAINGTGGLSLDEQEKLALKSYLTKRMLAKSVDVAIVASILACQYLVFFAIAKAVSPYANLSYLILNFFYWGMPIINIITVLGYQSAFEASQVQATPGKLMLGLYVEDLNGQIMRSESLVFKSFLFNLPGALIMGAYAYFYHARLQYGMGLDAASSTVLALVALTCFVTFASMHMLIGKEEKRRIVLDVVAGCRVKERK